uniref:Uncharacterized protein n=1 Tax=Populus davidiana TaxID=266767 RepID=A0A6M2F8N6_9ROSI
MKNRVVKLLRMANGRNPARNSFLCPVQVSYKHSSALWQCNPYSTPKPDKSHCFSLSLLLHFPFLRIHDENKRAQQSHKQNNLKTITTTRFFLVDKWMIPNQTKILSLRKRNGKKKPKEPDAYA